MTVNPERVIKELRELDAWDRAIATVDTLREHYDEQGWIVENDTHDPYAFTATRYGTDEVGTTTIKVYIDDVSGRIDVFGQRSTVTQTISRRTMMAWGRCEK